MEPHCWSPNLDEICNGFSMDSTGFGPKARNGSFSNSSLVLDTSRGELVKANVSVGKKGVSAERNSVALRNHCVAERNRRARINAHLDTLRTIVPGSRKVFFSLLYAIIELLYY